MILSIIASIGEGSLENAAGSFEVLNSNRFEVPRILEGLRSSGRLVGCMSTYLSTCLTSWRRVVAKRSPHREYVPCAVVPLSYPHRMYFPYLVPLSNLSDFMVPNYGQNPLPRRGSQFQSPSTRLLRSQPMKNNRRQRICSGRASRQLW
jgi:hypothetical protein